MSVSELIPVLEENMKNLALNIDEMKLSLEKVNEMMRLQDNYLNLDFMRIRKNEKVIRSIF